MLQRSAAIAFAAIASIGLAATVSTDASGPTRDDGARPPR